MSRAAIWIETSDFEIRSARPWLRILNVKRTAISETSPLRGRSAYNSAVAPRISSSKEQRSVIHANLPGIAFIGMTLFATACGGSSRAEPPEPPEPLEALATGSSTGAAATGSAAGSSSGGAPTGTGAGTTGGGGIAAGDPCTSNTACTSGVCGTDGTGLCCTAACATSDATCGATACDDTGACTYPTAGGACGTATCADGMLTPAGTCSGTGTCAPGTPTACGEQLRVQRGRNGLRHQLHHQRRLRCHLRLQWRGLRDPRSRRHLHRER